MRVLGKWLPDEMERLKFAVKRVCKKKLSLGSNSMSIEPESALVGPGSMLEETDVPAEVLESGHVNSKELSDGGVKESVWEAVARLVVTRNSVQCRQKWLFHLDWQQRGGVAMWSSQDDKTLLEALLTRAGRGAEDEDDVDWAELAQDWESARWSPYYLRTKWTSMRRQVPRYNFNTFQGKYPFSLFHS